MGAENLIRKQQRQKEKREAILKAARELIAKEGVPALSASRLARELGWTTPGLYYYFSNMEELKEALICELAEETVTISMVAAKKATNATECLLLAFRGRVEFYYKNPQKFYLPWLHLTNSGISQENLTSIIYPAADRLNSWLEMKLEEGKEQGVVNQNVHSRRLVNLMICLAQGILSMYLSIESLGGTMHYSLEEMIQEGEKTLISALRG